MAANMAVRDQYDFVNGATDERRDFLCGPLQRDPCVDSMISCLETVTQE